MAHILLSTDKKKKSTNNFEGLKLQENQYWYPFHRQQI